MAVIDECKNGDCYAPEKLKHVSELWVIEIVYQQPS